MPRTMLIQRARWLVGLLAITLAASLTLVPVALVSADEPGDMVLRWNMIAANALSNPTAPPTGVQPGAAQGPPISAIHLAMVQGAVYDAVNAIDGGHAPYIEGLPAAAAGASQAAAAAAAAYQVLIGLVPSLPQVVKDDLLVRYNTALADIGASQARTDGVAIGNAAAVAMLALRANDGRLHSEPFVPSEEVGRWRVVPPSPAANVQGQIATVTPLTLTSPDQFPTEGMPALTSAQYAAEFNEVKALGAQSGSSRTEAQTLMAGFYSANPLPFYNAGLRVIATNEGLSPSEQARLFVTTSMAGADALISCWSNKKLWNAWRPQTAIREAANDGNPLTEPDDDWLSLFATPGYPDEPSGYNCYTGGFWQSARFFFGTDKYAFSLTSPGVAANAAIGNPIGVPGGTRTYDRFTDVIRDTINGRILNGFHFRTADEHGAWIGKKTAQWVEKHYFEPVD